MNENERMTLPPSVTALDLGPLDLSKAVERIRAAKNLVVFTGAGVSKESGIPTFRDAQTGLWAQFSPEDLASREGFLKDPERVWSWYDFRRNKVWGVAPNAAHQAIFELERWVKQDPDKTFTLITQNIDNLHQRAGSEGVLELHGNIFAYKCLENHHPVAPESLSTDSDPESVAEVPPRCPQCNSWVRPNVVWFGEMLDPEILRKSYQAGDASDVMLVVGTSGVVFPAANIPIEASRNGCCVIEVNPEPSALSPFTEVSYCGTAAEILPTLVARVIQASIRPTLNHPGEALHDAPA